VDSEQTSEETAEQDTPAVPRRQLGLLIGIALLALVADVLTKILVVTKLEGNQPVRLLGGAVYFNVIRNSGAAFGMAAGMTIVFTLVAIGVVVAIVWLAPRLRSVGWAIGLGLVLAGALGNLTDRIFRAPGPLRGHVVDFISLFGPDGHPWPIFNVADSCICVGGVLIVLMAILGKDYDGGLGRQARLAETGSKP
jgi:signal peptidase II